MYVVSHGGEVERNWVERTGYEELRWVHRASRLYQYLYSVYPYSVPVSFYSFIPQSTETILPWHIFIVLNI